MFICVLDVFMSLVLSVSVPQAFSSGKKSISRFLDYVNSGNCQNSRIYRFGDLSKKTRTEKSWILTVLRPPHLSPRPDWWAKRWMVRDPPMPSFGPHPCRAPPYLAGAFRKLSGLGPPEALCMPVHISAMLWLVWIPEACFSDNVSHVSPRDHFGGIKKLGLTIWV